MDYVRDKLHESFEVEWPLTEEVLLDVEERPDRRVFPALSDEELSELEKSQVDIREPENDDEEMKKYKDLLPEK